MNLPSAAPLAAVSPSAFEDLTACQLRVAFKQQSDGAAAKTDAQIIGDALHSALADFIKAREFEHDQAVGLARARFVAALEQQAPESEVRGARPATARLTKIVGRVLELLAEAGSDAVALSETYLRARGGQLHGVVDLIIQSERTHVIADYKTGDVIDAEGDVVEHFQTQVQLYAVLEEERSGRWPERGVLLRFGGPPVPVDVDSDLCKATADRAVAALSAYNALEGQVPPANPGEDVCRFCSFAPRCPAFWETVAPDWRRGAVRGRVGWVEASVAGGVTIQLQDASGSYDGTVVIRRLSDEYVSDLAPGAELIVCGLHADAEGRLLPDRFAQVAVG